MRRPQKHHVGARAAESERDRLDYIRPGMFGLPTPPEGEPADPIFSLVGSMYGRRLLVRCDIPSVAEWLDEQATGATAAVKITDRYDVPYGTGDAFGVEADVPLDKFRITPRFDDAQWEPPEVYIVDGKSARIERDQLEPVSPGVWSLPPPEYGVPADPVFTAVGSMYGDYFHVRCDIPRPAERIVSMAEQNDDVEITNRYDLPYGSEGAVGVEATLPNRHLQLVEHSKPPEWMNVIGDRVR